VSESLSERAIALVVGGMRWFLECGLDLITDSRRSHEGRADATQQRLWYIGLIRAALHAASAGV